MLKIFLLIYPLITFSFKREERKTFLIIAYVRKINYFINVRRIYTFNNLSLGIMTYLQKKK